VGVCVGLFDGVDLSRATDGVDAVALAVVENVIGIAGNVDLGNNLTGIGVEHEQLGWKTTADEQPMIRFIERHWKISKRQICFPRRNDFPLVPIDDCDMTRIWDVNENSVAMLFQLKP